MRVVLVVGLLLSSGTMLGLSKVCEKESDKEKKGTLGCGGALLPDPIWDLAVSYSNCVERR